MSDNFTLTQLYDHFESNSDYFCAPYKRLSPSGWSQVRAKAGVGADPGDQVQGDGKEVRQGWGKAGELYKAGKDSLCWGFCRCTK